MLLMVEKGIRSGICHVIHQYVKGNNKYMKNYDKNNLNYLYRWAMSRKLPVGGFRQVENTSQFSKDLTKNYNEDSDFEADVQYPEK